MYRFIGATLIAALSLGLAGVSPVRGDEEAKKEEAKKSKHDEQVEGLTKVEGLFTLYHNDQKLLILLKPGNLGKDYIVLTSIARGISSGMVLGGMSWGFGDDVIWTFKKVGDKIHVIRRNVRFKAKAGTPEAEAVKLAYSDSVLYALPIVASDGGGDLVDATRVFMSDGPQIGKEIGPGFSFAADRSTWAKVKAFPKNVELQVAAVYTGSHELVTVSDPRGVQVNVHYSISELPQNDYHPRMADDRVGYFLTVVKDFSDDSDDQHFVRYINRWHLQKEDPKAPLSRPKNPIRFYIEKTVPRDLRPYVQEGIEEWNKAFEKLGYYKAIEVLQQPDDPDWDPEDVNYNTFRWITAEAGFAMGPSRVNPMTGQILDADIIFDASFLKYWKSEYETFTAEDARQLMGRPGTGDPLEMPVGDLFETPHRHLCSLSHGMQQQLGFAASVLMAQGATKDGELPPEFVHQALKEVVMHEVGHTLGLRHNFKASTWKPLSEIDGLPKDAREATVASVMDYSPANIAPKGANQGPYYTPTIGPYDYWAIEYGYKTIDGDEKEELEKIAARGSEQGHDFATDEDTRFYDSDPLANPFDLGNDPVAFSQRQMKLSTELVPSLVDRTVKEGEGYQRARQAFGLLFREYWRAAYYTSRFPSGVAVHRDHKGDPNGRPPFQVVDAEKQRNAMKLLAQTAFASPQYDSTVLNHLAATRWSHWGSPSYLRLDFPIHDFVENAQAEILGQLLNPITLARLRDSELKVPADADAYTLAEHVRLIVEGVFTEWKVPEQPATYEARKPYITSFRRNLQRMALKDLAYLVSPGFGTPEDARTLARMHLENLDKQAEALLAAENVKLDDYTRAHLLDSRNRIRQVLESELAVHSIN